MRKEYFVKNGICEVKEQYRCGMDAGYRASVKKTVAENVNRNSYDSENAFIEENDSPC